MIRTTTFTAKTSNEFKENFDTSLLGILFKPTLAFAFVSISMDFNLIKDTFKNKGIELIGASSCGELLFDKNNEVVSDKGAVFIITDIPKECFTSHFIERGESDSTEFGRKIGEKVNDSSFPASAIIVASGLTLDGQAMVEGANEVVGEDLIMFGGLAGDDSKFEKTYVFSNEKVSDDAVLVLLLDKNKIDVSGIASSGWISLGSDLRVTKSSGNIVYTIDDEPALDVYKSYLGVNDEDLPAIGIEYPLMIKRHSGEPALRAVVGINRDDRSLIFAGSVPESSLVTFSSSPGFEVIKTTTSKVAEFYERSPDADFFILFSCMARHLALGPMVAEEIKFASDKWDAPVGGFFTYGEIGSNNLSCDFFNQTYTLVKITGK